MKLLPYEACVWFVMGATEKSGLAEEDCYLGILDRVMSACPGMASLPTDICPRFFVLSSWKMRLLCISLLSGSYNGETEVSRTTYGDRRTGRIGGADLSGWSFSRDASLVKGTSSHHYPGGGIGIYLYPYPGSRQATNKKVVVTFWMMIQRQKLTWNPRIGGLHMFFPSCFFPDPRDLFEVPSCFRGSKPLQVWKWCATRYFEDVPNVLSLFPYIDLNFAELCDEMFGRIHRWESELKGFQTFDKVRWWCAWLAMQFRHLWSFWSGPLG